MERLLRRLRLGALGVSGSLALIWSLRWTRQSVNGYARVPEKSMRDYTTLLEQEIPSFKHPLLQIDDPRYPDYFLARGEAEAFGGLRSLRDWQAGSQFTPVAVEFAELEEKFAVADMILRRRAVDCAVLECVALTFDDGPGIYTNGILDVLGEYQGKATFYVLGQLIRHHPQTMRRMRDEEHEIANHTWSHPNLRTISDARILEEMRRAEAEIYKYTGVQTTNMRPPYGSYDQRVSRLVNLPLIMWSVDTSDWQHRDTAQTIARATDFTRKDDIVLMHDIHEPTAKAVPEIVRRLTARGMVLVTVEEILAAQGMEVAKAYERGGGQKTARE